MPAVLIAGAACVAATVVVYVASGGRVVFLPLVLVLPFTLLSFGCGGRR
jgi:hypothetical protein